MKKVFGVLAFLSFFYLLGVVGAVSYAASVFTQQTRMFIFRSSSVMVLTVGRAIMKSVSGAANA